MDDKLREMVDDPALVAGEPNYKRRLHKARTMLETGQVIPTPKAEETADSGVTDAPQEPDPTPDSPNE